MGFEQPTDGGGADTSSAARHDTPMDERTEAVASVRRRSRFGFLSDRGALVLWLVAIALTGAGAALPLRSLTAGPGIVPVVPSDPAPQPHGTDTGEVVLVAAGDIACTPSDPDWNGGKGTADACRQQATSDLLHDADVIQLLGDLVYPSASLHALTSGYDPSWGRFKEKTRPSLGNHEGTWNGSGRGYCTYFGAAAHCNEAGHQGSAGFYSYDVGAWHVVVLNTNCVAAGGCEAASPQQAWLRADLAANPAECTLAVFHHPLFSSSSTGRHDFVRPIWQTLYDAGVDVILTGHDHHYERFAPLTPTGEEDLERGIRSFIVGTGGKDRSSHHSVRVDTPHSEVLETATFGVLELTLGERDYRWEFLPEAGATFSDTGSSSCH
jgi:hypothetical protein